nr:reverse transcriptase domain-containing protein [Tanacetum cinerariifolium]
VAVEYFRTLLAFVISRSSRLITIIMENIPPPNNNPNAPEEEPILDQAPAAFVGFVPQWIASRDLLSSNIKVCAPGLMHCDMKSVHRGVKRLGKQMHDMYRMEKKMAKKLRQEELCLNGQEFDIPALDLAVRENRSKNSKMMRLITGLSREFIELKNQNHRAEEIMPPKRRSQTNPQPTLTQEDVDQLVRDGIEAAIRDERERFHGTEGAVGLVRWFEKMENTFEISECAKERKRLEDELRHLKLKDINIATYTERFNELALLCLDDVSNEKKKVELYIKGLLEIIKGETMSSKLVTLNEAVCMVHALMEQKIQAKNERIAEEEDPEEEPEEEDENMVNNEEDDVEVINPYEEVDPHNRPPPTSDEETGFAPPVVQIADADDVPISHVIQFGSNFHVGESSAMRDLLAGNKKIVQIKNQLLTARSRQKSYADVRHKPMEFEVGNKVMLKVLPWKGVIRFGKRVADALSQKDREPLRFRSLLMTVHTNLPENILEAWTEVMKEENVKAENLERLLNPIFEIRSNGI